MPNKNKNLLSRNLPSLTVVKAEFEMKYLSLGKDIFGKTISD